MPQVHCPALFISAPASGQGKTTVTAALAYYHRQLGRRVTVFKTGPDYLDPLLLEQASGCPAEPLDLWMMGESECRHALYRAACESDLILIEGAMGLFDGEPSSADLATAFGVPVAAVINARGMAQTLAAVALGLAHYRPALHFKGVIANRLGSDRHRQLIEEALSPETPLLAHLPREDALALPSRHLGLVPPSEQDGVEARIAAASQYLSDSPLTELPAPVTFEAYDTMRTLPASLAGHRIGVARDEAFSFIYAANLRLLEALGASLHFFSPLHDTALPDALDAIWLPGGYPELHAKRLSDNTAMREALRAHHLAGRPLLGECGGMLYLQSTLKTLEGDVYPMLDILPGRGEMRTRSGCQGMQSAPLPEGTFRGHAHHHSRSFDTLSPIVHGQRAKHPAPGEAIYRSGRTTGSYLHLYFPSDLAGCAALFTPDAV